MEDRHLSENFTLFQLTRTDHADLQKENRKVTHTEYSKLSVCAELLEQCRQVLGMELDVHSGRRCLALNRRVGSTDKSQHLKCEAVDFSPAGPDDEASVNAAFFRILAATRQGYPKFGQFIAESQKTAREGRKYWLHISLGPGYRDAAKCGEVLTMRDGKYTVVANV